MLGRLIFFPPRIPPAFPHVVLCPFDISTHNRLPAKIDARKGKKAQKMSFFSHFPAEVLGAVDSFFSPLKMSPSSLPSSKFQDGIGKREGKGKKETDFMLKEFLSPHYPPQPTRPGKGGEKKNMPPLPPPRPLSLSPIPFLSLSLSVPATGTEYGMPPFLLPPDGPEKPGKRSPPSSEGGGGG